MSESEPQRVLVAEDELVSQRVAKRCLEAMGYAVIVVNDGAAAVQACAQEKFGFVLMDLQMAHIDGLQATQEIRRQERPGQRVPIFGLSATAGRHDLAHCTAAGMNGLLIKPLQHARLHQALEESGLACPAKGRIDAELPGCADPIVKPVDLVMLRAKFGDDTVFLQRLHQAFVSSAGQLLNELGRAAETGERTLLRTLAHKIKGAGTNMHAHRVATLAARLESESSSMPVAELSQAAEALRRAFDEVTAYISTELR